MAIWSGFLNATAFFQNVTAFYLKHRRVLKKCRGVVERLYFILEIIIVLPIFVN